MKVTRHVGDSCYNGMEHFVVEASLTEFFPYYAAGSQKLTLGELFYSIAWMQVAQEYSRDRSHFDHELRMPYGEISVTFYRKEENDSH